jgi:hypothetical protein
VRGPETITRGAGGESVRTSLGVSTGSAVVCSALLTTAEDGTQTTEYRTVSADDNAPDLGELVASSIELMTTQIPGRVTRPSGIAVAYRSKDQAHSIRSAVAAHRHDLRLVPESAAALKYLHSTGEVAR